MKNWRYALLVSLAIFVLAAGVYGFSLYQKYRATLGEMSTAGKENKQQESKAEPAAGDREELEPFILLLLGISEREFL